VRDYKDWIENRAHELAEERYNKDYYDLPENIQQEIYTRAEADYIDHHASQIDALCDRMRELGGSTKH